MQVTVSTTLQLNGNTIKLWYGYREDTGDYNLWSKTNDEPSRFIMSSTHSRTVANVKDRLVQTLRSLGATFN